MEPPGAAAGGAGLSGASVPAFLTKLWTLVEDPDTDPLIRWSPSGTSFHVFDHSRFSKEVLPKFFKHNNMASFIRQLNMYGFRKVVHIEQGGLLKPETDDTEFQHPSFIRGQEVLLEHIKRKVTTVSSVRQEEVKMSSDDVNKILNDVQLMKGKQETIDSRIVTMKHENEALWREVASLRQKHLQQQKVVNKLIQFLVSLVQSNRVLGVKRKIPLMLSDSSSAHSAPKYSRPFSLEHMQAAASVFDVCDAPLTSEPILSDVTDLATPTDDSVLSDWMDAGGTRAVTVKAEPSSPELELCADGAETPVDTPFSPSTFINSILEEEPLSTSTSAAPAGPIVVMSPGSTGPPPPANTSQHLVPVSHGPTSPRLQQTCQTVACIDRPRPPPSAGGLSPDVWRFLSTRPDKSELTNHVESMDSSLESLQSVLNTPTFSFDTSPLMEFFSPSCFSGDFDVDTLDTLLCDDVPNGGDAVSAGKQLVQYTATPVLTSDPNLPSLLEAELEPFIAAEDPDGALLSHAPLDSDL